MSGRIRSIKPEILEDAKTASLDSDSWRLFVSLFLVADDHGNFRATPTLLEGLVFHSRAPREPLAELLARLSRVGLVVLYENGGQKYGSIANWKKHQKVDRPSSPRVPGPCDAGSVLSREAREDLALLSRLIPIPIPTTDLEGEPIASQPRPGPKTLKEAQATIVPDADARALVEHWWSCSGRSPSITGMPPVLVEQAKLILANAGVDLELAKRVVTAYCKSDHKFWVDRKWALGLLTEADDFGHALALVDQGARTPAMSVGRPVPRNDAQADHRAFVAQVERERAAEAAAKATKAGGADVPA